MADCSKFADRQRQSFCLQSCCAYVAPHTCYQRPKGSSVAFGDEMDIISQVRRHLTTQCLAHQTGEFELHSPPNRKPVQLVRLGYSRLDRSPKPLWLQVRCPSCRRTNSNKVLRVNQRTENNNWCRCSETTQQSANLVGRVIVLLQIWVSQSLLHSDPFVRIESQHLVQ